MKHYNDGIIRTNEKCIGCNRCIAACPIKNPNVAISENGHSYIAVASSRCIDCGACINACYAGARSYVDDSLKIEEAINNNESLSFIIDPTFFVVYKDIASNVVGYLQSLNGSKVYDMSLGAEISCWAHAKYVRDHFDDPEAAFITNNCSSVINYIEKYDPESLKYLIPIHSPSMCMAIYARKYLNDTNKMVLVSPCPSKIDENNDNNNPIDYVGSVKGLLNYISDKDISSYEGESDAKIFGSGRLSILGDGFFTALQFFISKGKILYNHEGIDADYFDEIKLLASSPKTRPQIVNIMGCKGGCLSGPGIETDPDGFVKRAENVRDIINDNLFTVNAHNTEDANFDALDEISTIFNYDDFVRGYENKYHKPHDIPDRIYDIIFTAMHKDEDWKKHMDCGSCGYKTCREMVESIAYGYNRMESCVHYVNDELMARYFMDYLTKIPNREGFKVRVKKLYDENPEKTYVIGVVSINQLNIINDLYGFNTGDNLIIKASEISTAFCKDGGGVAGRLGAGEFLLCFEYNDVLIKRIFRGRTYSFSDIPLSFPLSYRAGLYVDNDRNENIDTMINYCSLARDKIDEGGISTCLYYDDDLKEKLATEAMVTSTMYSAIENREFVAYFQPQYSHKNKCIVGAETLCRWIKSDGTVISPGVFIPIFERNGFIKTLDKYMWELAFKAVLRWSAMNVKMVPISVNVSRVSLDEDDFVDNIKALLKQYPIDTSYLHFEITESAYSERPEAVTNKINELHKLGFRLAMDDFGTGYSSLNILKDMPLDILKLDMGFFLKGNEDKGESIIRNVVSMGKDIKLNIIAEGVETVEHAEFLRNVGCDTIQGFLYARPMPQRDYEAMINIA